MSENLQDEVSVAAEHYYLPFLKIPGQYLRIEATGIIVQELRRLYNFFI